MLLLWTLQAIAYQSNNNPLIFSNPDQIYRVNDYVKVYQTPDTISPQQAWSRILNGEMEQVPYQGNPGMTNSDVAYWLVFTIANQYPYENDFRLELSYPQLDLTSLSLIEGDSARTLFVTGDSFEFSKRPLENRNFVFPLTIDFGQEGSFLLNADKRNSAVRFPLRLFSEEHFVGKTYKEQVYLTVYYIFLIILVLISVAVGISLKNRVFIWYAISVFCYGLWLFTWQGFSYKYLTANWPEFNRHFLAFCSQIAIMSLLVFVQSFFETKTTIPRFHKLMNGVLGFFVLGTIVWIIIPNTYIAYAPKLFALRYLLVGSILTFSITAAIKYRNQGMNRTLIFAISYALFFITIVGKVLDEYGLISEFNFVVDPILIGNLIQVLGLLVAMMIILLKVVKERELLQFTNQELTDSLKQKESIVVEPKVEYITLKSNAVINLNEVLYITSDAAYCEFHLKGREHPEIDRKSLTSLEEELPDNFVRIHRSTIINLNHTKQVRAASVIMNSGVKLVVSRTYKEQLLEIAGKS